MLLDFELKNTVFYSIGYWIGNIGAVSFFFVSFPQILLNYRRKSTNGFSALFVLIRLFGISFQISFGIIGTLQKSALFTAFLIALENMVFLIQLSIYRKNRYFLLGFLLPLPGIITTLAFRESIVVTKWFYSICQVVCYIPYIITLISTHSTLGVSLFGQHLNFIGSLCGILMCCITVESDIVTWIFYIFSFFQALSVFFLALAFDEYRIIDQPVPGQSNPSPEVIKLGQSA